MYVWDLLHTEYRIGEWSEKRAKDKKATIDPGIGVRKSCPTLSTITFLRPFLHYPVKYKLVLTGGYSYRA